MFGTPRAGKNYSLVKNIKTILDKQYLNICDSFLDLRVVSKGLTCRKQPNNLPTVLLKYKIISL